MNLPSQRMLKVRFRMKYLSTLGQTRQETLNIQHGLPLLSPSKITCIMPRPIPKGTEEH